MSSRLQGKVAIVTGAGSGFGKGIATKFLQEGAKVVIADFSVEWGSAAAKELNCDFHETDVTKRDSWQSLLKTTLDKHGRLDIVINNAGGTYKNKPTMEVTDEDFDKVVNLNMKSIYLSAAVVVPYFQKEGKGGVVINIASTAGIRPRPGLTWYNASKAAASNATKTMAVEYAKDKIRFNAVCPVVAFVGSTNMTSLFLGKDDTAENRTAFDATIPLGRGTKPSDVANACAYLASDEAEFVTGINFEVDGGRCV